MIACVSPERTVRSTPFRIGVSPTATCRSRMTNSLTVVCLLARRETQPGLDRVQNAALQLRDADAFDDVGEEPAYHQSPRLVLRDAARLQVEQLLVVESSRGTGVSRAGDLAGLDLEVRHRVRARPLRQQQVAVQFVGV